MINSLNNKIASAAKWSSITQIVAKLIAPITNMILARLLTPESFGVVATTTMVFSFADIFTDSGFQKYLIQHQFKDEKEMYNTATVAFWSNFIFSILLWVIIAIFSDSLAVLVGNPGLGNVIIISCLSLPLTSFSSIQIALYRREFDFKTLFKSQMIISLIPIIVTVPLALILRNYWAIIIGTIVGNLFNAIILMVKSKWKPRIYYNFSILKNMFSFSIWSLIEAITIWLTNYIGVFIVSFYMTSYHVGLYKTSINTVNQLTNLITMATTPVLFSALSCLQNDNILYEKMFFKFQRMVATIVIPMGFGIFLYRDLVTKILLGNQWLEANNFIGLWGMTSAIAIVLSHYSSEVYRSKGRPKLSVLAQVLHIIVLVPVIVFSSKRGFESLTIWRALVRLQMVLVHAVIMQKVIGISFTKVIKNIMPQILCTIIMIIVAVGLLTLHQGIVWEIISIFICISVYFGSLLILFSKTRKEIFDTFFSIIKKKKLMRSV